MFPVFWLIVFFLSPSGSDMIWKMKQVLLLQHPPHTHTTVQSVFSAVIISPLLGLFAAKLHSYHDYNWWYFVSCLFLFQSVHDLLFRNHKIYQHLIVWPNVTWSTNYSLQLWTQHQDGCLPALIWTPGLPGTLFTINLKFSFGPRGIRITSSSFSVRFLILVAHIHQVLSEKGETGM